MGQAIAKKQTDVDLPGGKLGVLIRELQQLRWAKDAAEWTLLKRCQEVEESGEWREQFETFDTLLERFCVCAPRRYREFISAERTLGETKALAKSAGMASVLKAATISKPVLRANFLEAANARAAATGVPWSDQEAKTMRDKIAGSEPKASVWNARVTELSTLRVENVRLQRENRELVGKVRDLEAKLRAAGKAKTKA